MTVLSVVPSPLRRSSTSKSLSDRRRTSEVDCDSPGDDVVRRHPTLPDSVYYRAVRAAVERESALEAYGQNGRQTIDNE